MTDVVLRRLYLDPRAARGKIGTDPVPTPEVAHAFGTLLRRVLVEHSADYSFDTRRSAVDVAKRMQHLEALLVLRDADEQLAHDLDAPDPGGDPALAAQARDLLDRIEGALHPYFD